MKKLSFQLIIAILLSLLLTGCELPVSTHAEEIGNDSEFIVYFIDVGQADSALVICDGYTMLIDGGNVADSSLIYSFLENHGIAHLDYIVASHAHEDHVGGLAGALNFATAGIALSPVTEYDSRAFGNFVKYLGERGVEITVPTHGDRFMLGSAAAHIVGPVGEFSDTNNGSIVLMITYGATSFLFTGDVERNGELAILDAGYDISATVLKVAHHGGESSTTYPFLNEVMPDFAIISVGERNQYGHPHENTMSRLRDADVTVFRTDMQGTVMCVSDGEYVSFTVERNGNAETNPTRHTGDTDAEEYYIGNVNTKRVHRPSCSGLPREDNRIILDSLDRALGDGYVRCGTCKP